MDIVYIDKCRYEIQEQKEVPVWYTGIYRPISSTGQFHIFIISTLGERCVCVSIGHDDGPQSPYVVIKKNLPILLLFGKNSFQLIFLKVLSVVGVSHTFTFYNHL
jgi:hypothetical protein